MFSPILFGSAKELTKDNSFALGQFADYRVELKLALDRAMEMRTTKTGIFVGSIIDNVAYHFINYEDFTRSGIDDEAQDTRFYLTSATLYAILVDSLEADVIVYLPQDEERSTTDYNYRVDQYYQEIFRFFDMKVITATGKDKLKPVVDEIKRLQKEAHDQRDSNQESSEEEPQRSGSSPS